MIRSHHGLIINYIINLIKSKSIFYKSHTANENSTDKKEAIKTLQNKLTSTIENAKNEYYSKLSMKHSNPETSSKVNWSILKSFLNDKKIPIIPPLYHSGNFITDFRQKAELFKSYFAEQRSMLQNSSKLRTNLAPQTDQSLTSINFSQDRILKIVQSLNPNKAHGPDKLSIPMIKICGKSGDSFKIFERIIYNNISEYLTTNKLLSDNQSGFKPCDSYVNHFFINYS